MLFQNTISFKAFKGSTVCGLVATCAVGLFCACLPGLAQERAGGEQRSRFMERIDAEEGARRLAEFRQQRLDGDFCFQFELEFKPRRERTVRYEGVMWGSWNEVGPITRFRVVPKSAAGRDASEGGQSVELIVQNGHSPQAWIRRSEGERFQLVEGDALFDPILPGLLYSPFDLQMPFVYWEDFVYEGPTLVGATRIAQQFLMQPPVGSASALRGIAGVRVGLDDTYNALWRIEVVDAQQEVLSRFAVESFQKVQEQYIVKRITLKDTATKDRTTFEVEAASVGLSLSRDLFDPDLALVVDRFVPERMEKL